MDAQTAIRIADAVHGTVELTKVEAEIIGSRAYQRMRGVKHLGLASLAFPGADYSRFAHGIGTLHVTSLILDNIRINVEGALSDDQVRLYRLAALLHDIGHYPFSHTFERALTDFYISENVIKPRGDPDNANPAELGRWLHEDLGSHVIHEDAEVAKILGKYDIDLDALTGIITRTKPPTFANLVSSDLDADRIDYLMRTAIHTGLPYGNVDLPYLLSQIWVDNAGRICFKSKGMRAAEHLLISRYFDYQQISYHKTVAGLELVLNDAVGALLEEERLDCSKQQLRTMLGDGRWYNFDDAFIIDLMRKALVERAQGEHALLYESILARQTPKLVVDREILATASSAGQAFSSLEREAKDRIEGWKAEFTCRFYLWTQRTGLTKIGSRVPASAISHSNEDDDDYDKLQQAVRISTKDGSSIPIQEHSRSLISVLSEHNLYSLRIYVLLPPDRLDERDAIAQRLNSDLGHYFEPA